jgi:hypothetical protein
LTKAFSVDYVFTASRATQDTAHACASRGLIITQATKNKASVSSAIIFNT